MIWLVALACAGSAALHLAVVVPRLPEPEVGEDGSAPSYASLAPVGHVALLALIVLALSSVLLWVPVEHLAVWFGYLGAGGALVWVDLRTTWLPRTLTLACGAQMALGLIWVAAADWPTALGAVAGGAVAFLLFHLVWRFSSAFGYGDVRLAALVGAMGGLRGLEGWLLALVCGTLLGAVWAIIHALRRRGTNRPAYFAYGPALWLGPIAAVTLSGW
ncbi:MAG: A24 family peptidase [Propionibacteriaceae bacterium]|nr:A24 family peptidase [Propionibacteriaceae bacterium]